ncbi:MAG TPA: hypothetical protein VK395_23270, partial [Gemmataceae bacterium]|nr:hypothetical protein [Gemmataceae bacterium]
MNSAFLIHFHTFYGPSVQKVDAQVNALPTLSAVSRTAEPGDLRRTQFTRHSPLVIRHFGFSVARAVDPGGSPRSSSTFREGGLE